MRVDIEADGTEVYTQGEAGPFAGPVFEPRVYESPNRCCWHVTATGFLGVEYWYTHPVFKAHEMTHVAIWFYHWADLDAEVARYSSDCYSQPKAGCWRDYLAMRYQEFRLRALAENTQWDCEQYRAADCLEADKQRERADTIARQAYDLLTRCVGLN